MKKGHIQKYQFQFRLSSGPEELWPLISDTDKNFRYLGANPIYQTSVSRNIPKGFLELSHNRRKSYAIWEESPYFWEKPYRFGFTRKYRLGMLKMLQANVELRRSFDFTEVSINLKLQPSQFFLSYFIKFYIEQVIKRKLEKRLYHIDEMCGNSLRAYDHLNSKIIRVNKRRIEKLKKQLGKETKRQRIVNRLFEFLQKAPEEELERIHPYALAELWGEKKYAVLNVFLNAAKLNILDFEWDVCCPSCKLPRTTFRKMKELRKNLYCEECNVEYKPDFNKNIHLVFKPNPLIRKITPKQFCIGGPHSRPHRVIQLLLSKGETRYLNVQLKEGTYHLKSYSHDGYLKINVREEAEDNVTFYITDQAFNEEEINISCTPNLVIKNISSQDVVCFVDSLNWKQEAIYASEVSSSPDFNALFSRETIKENSKIKASDLTLLFTDLMNSTELYVQEGDELAIGRVMSHFKIIQQIVAEERGGIVKTIGDSVMAVFREPVSALKAVQRIQQIFTTSSTMSESFKLKAGIHMGDCTAVNLNGRIDYFGTTVNIAARLVDTASEKELMVSESVYAHPDVQLYLERNSRTFFVKDTLQELKGFEDEEFRVKQIKMERPKMKLVI